MIRARAARAGLVLLAATVFVPVAPRSAGALSDEIRLDRLATLSCGTRACVTGMQFAPNGDLYVNVRSGQIRIIRNRKLLAKPFATVQTTTDAEGGLLGLALDPDFESTRRVYVFRTSPNGARDMVESIDARGARRTLMDLPAGGGYHHGGILAFGPGNKLYVSNGEAHDPGRAQDPRVRGGKIYRINPNGSIPDGNPFGNNPTWSYGHRNTFGLAFDPETERLWESENGPSGVDDEVNVIRKGGNYGWPDVQGTGGDGRYIDPVRHFQNTIAPTMMAFGGDAFPEGYRGDLFMGAYVQGTIHRFVLDDSRTGIARDEIFNSGQGVVGMTFGPDGLYFGTDDGVWRIRPKQAQAPTESPTPNESPSPTPTPTATGTVTADEGGSGTPWWPFVVFVIALGAGAYFLVARNRRA